MKHNVHVYMGQCDIVIKRNMYLVFISISDTELLKTLEFLNDESSKGISYVNEVTLATYCMILSICQSTKSKIIRTEIRAVCWGRGQIASVPKETFGGDGDFLCLDYDDYTYCIYLLKLIKLYIEKSNFLYVNYVLINPTFKNRRTKKLGDFGTTPKDGDWWSRKPTM